MHPAKEVRAAKQTPARRFTPSDLASLRCSLQRAVLMKGVDPSTGVDDVEASELASTHDNVLSAEAVDGEMGHKLQDGVRDRCIKDKDVVTGGARWMVVRT